MIQLIERLECEEKRELIDSKIKSEYISEATVVMFGYQKGEALHCHENVERRLRTMHRLEQIAKQIIEAHQGKMIEHSLWLFPSPYFALSAVLLVRDGILLFFFFSFYHLLHIY